MKLLIILQQVNGKLYSIIALLLELGNSVWICYTPLDNVQGVELLEAPCGFVMQKLSGDVV